MKNSNLILITSFIFFITGLIVRILINKKIIKIISLLATIISFSCILELAIRYFKNIENNFISLTLKNFTVFIIDYYAVIMAITSILVGLLIIIYSFDYIKEEDQNEYYFYILLFIGSMLSLIFSGNLIVMYIFWEITSICSWKLIGYYKKNINLYAANKSFLVTFLGSILMLLSITIIYQEHSTLNIPELRNKVISDFVAFFLILGMIAKSAQIPFHIWLPEASVAPTPVTALLHAAVLVKIGVYTFGRIFDFTFKVLPEFQTFEINVSIFTILISSFMALREKDIKKILAYSTISQLGYIFLGFALNTKISIIGAIFYIVSHAFAKAGLFLSAGIVEYNTKQKNIFELGGLSKNMPLTCLSFMICGFSIIGLPIFSGFWGKYFILSGIISLDNKALALIIIFSFFLTLLYIFRLYNKVFLGEKKFEVKEETSLMVGVVLLLSIFSLIIGIFPKIILNLIKI